MASPSAQSLRTKLASVTLAPRDEQSRYISWARTFTCTPSNVFVPTTEEQCALILQLARIEGKNARAIGAGHSPSDLPCTTDFMIRTDKLNRFIEANIEKEYVVVEAGMHLHTLHEHLARHGLAMSNVGSISDQSLAGVIATATHGTGIDYGCMSTQVLAMDMLLADGTRVRCSRSENSDLFLATLCGLGVTGIILRVTLQVERAFRLKEFRECLTMDEIIENLPTIVREAEHVRFWWYPQSNRAYVCRASRSIELPQTYSSWFWDFLLGVHLWQILLFIGRFFPNINYYAGLFFSSPRFFLYPITHINDSHKVFNLECPFPQHTTEWSVPFSKATHALRDIKDWLDREHADPKGLRPHFPIEVRFTKADDIWLSPSFGEASCWIGILQHKPYAFSIPYKEVFRRYEDIVTRYNGRPHWAKMHGLGPTELRGLYPHFDDFERVVKTFDPEGLFRNEYIRRHIFGETGENLDRKLYLKDV